jgi:hypothetical protein
MADCHNLILAICYGEGERGHALFIEEHYLEDACILSIDNTLART